MAILEACFAAFHSIVELSLRATSQYSVFGRVLCVSGMMFESASEPLIKRAIVPDLKRIVFQASAQTTQSEPYVFSWKLVVTMIFINPLSLPSMHWLSFILTRAETGVNPALEKSLKFCGDHAGCHIPLHDLLASRQNLSRQPCEVSIPSRSLNTYVASAPYGVFQPRKEVIIAPLRRCGWLCSTCGVIWIKDVDF